MYCCKSLVKIFQALLFVIFVIDEISMAIKKITMRIKVDYKNWTTFILSIIDIPL